MTVLVAGSERVDAGKTTYGIGLLHRIDGTGFKPRAGNDYWYDHGDVRRAIDAGRLYGKDAARLAAAGADDRSPEELNPIHRLWQPAPDGDPFIGASDRQFVLDRIGDGYVVNADARVPAAVREALPLEGAPRVSTVDELNRVIEAQGLSLLSSLADRVARADRPVIESYGDIARPLRGLEPDRVAVVGPGRVRIYDGGRYADACEVASGSPRDGRLEERVGDVIGLLEPDAVATLSPLTEGERADPGRVADAYGSAYDPLT